MKDILARIAELEDLAAKATPEKWVYSPGDDFDDWTIYAYTPDGDSVAVKQDDSGVPIRDEDGEFIAASRTAVPELCSRVRELVAVNKELRDLLENVHVRPITRIPT